MGAPLRQAFTEASEPESVPPPDPPASAMGVVVCLPTEPTESDVGLLLEGARKLLAARKPSRFVLVQQPYDTKDDESSRLNICESITAKRVSRVIEGYDYVKRGPKGQKTPMKEPGLGGTFVHASARGYSLVAVHE